MTFSELRDLAQKGFAAIVTLKNSGGDITTVATAMNNIFMKDPKTVTKAEMDETHALLLSELAEYSIDRPD